MASSYCAPHCMASVDPDSQKVRCGQLSIFYPFDQQKETKRWIGITCYHLFASTWPNKKQTKEESIIGKIAYSSTWLDEKKKSDVVDFTKSVKVLHINRAMGIVIRQSFELDLCEVLIDSDFPIHPRWSLFHVSPKIGDNVRIISTNGRDQYIENHKTQPLWLGKK